MGCTIAGFTSSQIETTRGEIFVAQGGEGSPVLLLHGFPETHLMWRDIAPALARSFLVVCADLPGYGRSGCPASDPRHSPYSKRGMAETLVEMMSVLGHERFAVIGHDRGGRVAYRMALDHPTVVSRLAVFDVIPTGALWDRSDARLTIAFWPFSFLAQPEPLPERLIGACPEAVIDDALGNWGSAGDVFPPDVRAAYVGALSDPAHLHAICEEYRAAATIDREHDQADAVAGRRIAVPLLALWSETGGLNSWYRDEGGPLARWRALADDVRGGPVAGGHFFPEEDPARTAETLRHFLADGIDASASSYRRSDPTSIRPAPSGSVNS
jgi:haloacetate dehalogenase